PGEFADLAPIVPFRGAYTPQPPILATPVWLEQGTIVSKMISYNSGDGIPRLSAVAGTTEATGEPVAAVTFEVPHLMSQIANGSRDKAVQECRDVVAFIAASGAWPGQVTAVVPGPRPNHPPDV